ncbi:MAG: 4Fe-4S ferredoxin [archaeon]|nr:4Fe-4S ferredoxin [archaeon]
MTKKIISKSELNSIIMSLSKEYDLYAPALGKTENSLKYIELSSDNYEFPEFQNTRIPPKDILFPRTEELFSYKNLPDGNIEIEEPQEEKKEKIIFGIRSCDARSFKLFDIFFDAGKYSDYYYFKKRNRTIFIGMACNQPFTTCFCTSVKGDPFSKEGLDIQIIDLLNETYLIIGITEKGEKILSKITIGREPSQEELNKVSELAEESKNRIKLNIELGDIKEKLDNLYESDIWESDTQKCLGCGSCTFICPTCHCFDVQDQSNAEGGKRIRIWDSCQFPMFTKEGSGHNPRNFKKQRMRQRIYHKFNFYLSNYDCIGCVGCGRCIRACPSCGDVRQTLELITQKVGGN